jgi:YD repeat-containing protein
VANENPTLLVSWIIVEGFTLNSSGTLTPVTSVTRFSYDDQGQLVSIDGPLPGNTEQTRTFRQRFDYQYPQRPGKLFKQINPDGSSYQYGYDAMSNLNRVTDPAGNIISETKIVDGITYTTGYGYDPAGRIIRMTYPDGLVVNYERDAIGNIAQVTADRNGIVTILADNMTHLPFGPLKAMTLGNGIVVRRSFDQLYRMTANGTTGVLDQQYSRDPIGNVTAVTDTVDPTANLSFIYDDLYRLIDADSAGFGNIGFDYDAVSNRQSRTLDGLAETYQYSDVTNQLALITNTEVTDVVTVFHYDLNGLLIDESDGQGMFSKVYIYLDFEFTRFKLKNLCEHQHVMRVYSNFLKLIKIVFFHFGQNFLL